MKKKFSIFGIFLGLVVAFIGLCLILGFKENYHGSTTLSYSFGADFYTEEYNATENAANNIEELGYYFENVIKFVLKVMGFLVIALGGVIICYFSCKLAEVNNNSTPISQLNNGYSQSGDD